MQKDLFSAEQKKHSSLKPLNLGANQSRLAEVLGISRQNNSSTDFASQLSKHHS